MKKLISLILAVCMLCACLNLGGCSSLLGCAKAVEQPKTHLVVVYAACSNNAVPALSGQLYDTVHKLASEFGSSMSVIVADGDPFLHYNRHFNKPNTIVSQNKLQSIINAYTGEALSAMSDARAATPEVDLISALNMASRQLRASEYDGMNKEILVISSGLSTVQPLDFTRNLLEASPEAIVETLKGGSYLPDLSCVDRLSWLNLGDTALPQKPLLPAAVNSLMSIWSAILDASGAPEVYFAPDLPTESSRDDYPDVKEVVTFAHDSDPVEVISDTPVFLDRILFKYDSAELAVDKESAHEILKPYVSFLHNNSSSKLLVAGTSSRDGAEDYNRRLSLRRAEAIKTEFVSLGANPDQLVCIGLGYSDHPYRARFTDASGREVENHLKNMSALIVNIDLDAAKELLALGLS